MIKNIREYENLHIALWLVKDTCWVMGDRFPMMRYPGMFMIIPTVLVAIHIAWRSRNEISDFFHNIAVCLWIAANGTWMIGEFYYDDGTRPIAMVFFGLGIIVIAAYYGVQLPRIKKQMKAKEL